jgi:hypothetical protein
MQTLLYCGMKKLPEERACKARDFMKGWKR